MSATPLPIVCAWCERVRTSAGRWEEREVAEFEPSEATHGICPDCLVEEQHAAALAIECPVSGEGRVLIPAGARSLP